jgi:tetratricopeptide (TPR) repeat protein
MPRPLRNPLPNSSPDRDDDSRLLRRAAHAIAAGDLTKAERRFNKQLQRQPDCFDALHGLSQIHIGRGCHDTAVVLMQQALRAHTRRADGFATLGLAFHGLHRFEYALVSYDEALRIGLEDITALAELYNRRGVAQLELRRGGEALQSFERALALSPEHPDALGNYGNALLMLNRPEAAVAAYDRALRLLPEHAGLLTNRAVALRRLDRPREALMSVRRALVGEPGFAEARFVEAVAALTLGDFDAGWRGYEARWGVGRLVFQKREFEAPLWLGEEPLDGKTVLLHAEQGFGDTLNFVRYSPLVARRGAKRIVLEVQRELVRLLTGLPGVDAVIARGEPLPAFDCHCPLLSLPLAFATTLETIPAGTPYLRAADADIVAWRKKLPASGPLIGLVWSGDDAHENDANRSIPLDALAPLLSISGTSFVSLQHVVRERDLAALARCDALHRLKDGFCDFGDTAAVIASLDAVISVDTAVAHLAGAMGKPLGLLLPYAADFRWLRERSDSPWYPTARLYRQACFGDWAGAIGALAHDLRQGALVASAARLSA